jgi:DNA-binding transcriptional LysR family regulator
VELRDLRSFVAVAEEGGLSAAARRLNVSQSALSQTVQSLERELGVILLVRSSTGTRLTDAGNVLLAEARALLRRHDDAVAAVTGSTSGRAGPLRIGVPLELPADLLPAALVRVRASLPQVRADLHHLSTAAQIAALRDDRLDVGLVRERPPGAEFDSILVLTERLGVLLQTELTEELADGDGLRLEALEGVSWIGFPRAGSPAWYDHVTAVLREHGVIVDEPAEGTQSLIAEVKLAAVETGRVFTLAPPNWTQPLPDGVSWCALAGAPLVRRTWAVWAAGSRRRDVGVFVAALESQEL